MGFYLKLYAATLIAFFAIDMLWLGVAARSFYQKHLGFLLAPSPNWGAALLFYLLFVAGMVIFVLVPGLKAGSLSMTLVKGALFGLVVYAGYDLTNQATVKDWPVVVTVVDMIWGTILSTAVCVVGYAAGKWLA